MFARKPNKIKVSYASDDIYKHYTNKVTHPVDKPTFYKLLKEFNNEVLRMVIYDGMDYCIGSRLGSIRIKRFDNSLRLDESGEVANKLRPNWGKTLNRWRELYPDKTPEELKEIKDKPIIYHLNEHTDGYAFRWYWDKITSNVKNQSAYKFEPVRDIKREAAQAWKNIPALKDKYYE